MEPATVFQQQTKETQNEVIGNQLQQPRKHTHYLWWLRIALYTTFVMAGCTAGTILGRLYFDKGGNTMWMATLLGSVGFPILFIPRLWFSPTARSPGPDAYNSSSKSPSLSTMTLLYLTIGLVMVGDNLMYTYGLYYLPVSTYSLICGTQLAFSALFSFLINSQKFTGYILNSVVLVTMSTSLLAIHAGVENTTSKVPKGKFVSGFMCTLGASATFALYLSAVQLAFQKVIRRETFSSVIDMQMYPAFFTTCACVVGLFASGEWRGLGREMEGYEQGKVSYVMNVFWTAVSWQVFNVGLIGLIFEVSSLFSNVISTLGVPLVPILSVGIFHDSMDGVKVVALLLALWGFVSYVYQQYLDDSKSKAAANNHVNGVSGAAIQIC